jgi:MFS family permease
VRTGAPQDNLDRSASIAQAAPIPLAKLPGISAAARRRSFAVYGACLVLTYAGIGMATPLLPVFAERLAIGSQELSLLYAVFSVATIAGLPLLGRLSDRAGRRRVLAAGLLANAAGALLMACAPGLPMLMAGRALQGLALAAGSCAAPAALADLDPGIASRQAALATTLTMVGGSVAGPLASGIAAELGVWPQGLGLTGYALLALVAVPLLRLAVETRPALGTAVGSRQTATGFAPRRSPVLPALPRAFWRACACSGLCAGVQATVFTLGVSRIALISPAHPCAAAAMGVAAYMLGSTAGQFSGRWIAGRTVEAGLIATMFGLPMLGLAGTSVLSVMLLLAAVVTGFGHGLVNIGTVHDVNVLAPPAERGLFTSLFSLSRSAGAGLPVLAAGAFATRFETLSVLDGFIAITCLCALGLVCLPCIGRVLRPAQ